MKPSPFGSLWGGPIAMAVLTTTGLASALVSDTWGDWWSWVGLGVPVAVMSWFAWRRPASRASNAAPNRAGKPRADTAYAANAANAANAVDVADDKVAAHAAAQRHNARTPSL